LFYSLRTNIPGLEAIEVVEGMNAVRRRASARMRFARRTSILLLTSFLVVVFGAIQLVLASGQTVSAPSQPTFSLNTANQEPGDFVLSGFNSSATQFTA